MAAKSQLGQLLPPLLVAPPNIGVYLGADDLAAPPRSLITGHNVRIRNGSLDSRNLGYANWSASAKHLNGPVKLVDLFITEAFAVKYLLADNKDLYEYIPGTDTLKYRTPIYAESFSGVIASVVGSTVTGTGTFWATPTSLTPPANKTTRKVLPGDQISFGNDLQDSLTATWFTITNVATDTSLTVSGSPGAFAGAYTIRQVIDPSNLMPTGGFSYTYDTFTNADVNGDGSDYRNMWIAVHSGGISFPFFFTSSNTFAKYIARIPYIPRTMAIWKNVVLYANLSTPVPIGGDPVLVTLLPTSFLNSDAGRPQTFTGGIAGQFAAMGSDTSEILCMAPLGDNLMFYSREQVVAASFTGDASLRFLFQVAVPNRGVLGAKLVAVHTDHHEFLAEDCLYWFNGTAAAPTDLHVWHELVKTLDFARLADSYVFVDKPNGENIWALGLTTDGGVGTHLPFIAYVSHFLEGTGAEAVWGTFNHALPYTTRSFGFTAVGQWNTPYASPTQRTIAGGAGGTMFVYGETSTANGSAMPFTTLFPRALLAANRARCLVRRVYPYTSVGTGTLTVTVTVFNQIGQTGSSSTFSYDLTQAGNRFVSPYRRGVWAQVQFSGNADQGFLLHGYDTDRTLGGAKGNP